MAENNVWRKAQSLQWKVSEHITPGFDIGFDQQIPADTQNELRLFVKWVEQDYRIPITLWVDFEYKHYWVRRDGKRVGYLFYWSDISSYPVFDCKEDIPVIRLPVRTEHRRSCLPLLRQSPIITHGFARNSRMNIFPTGLLWNLSCGNT